MAEANAVTELACMFFLGTFNAAGASASRHGSTLSSSPAFLPQVAHAPAPIASFASGPNAARVDHIPRADSSPLHRVDLPSSSPSRSPRIPSAWSFSHLQLPPFFLQPSGRHPSTMSSRGSRWPRPSLARTSPGAHLPRFPSRTFQSLDPNGHPTSLAPPSLSTEASIVQRASSGTLAQMSRSDWRWLTAASGLRRSLRQERGGLKAPTGAALTGGSACASMQAGGPLSSRPPLRSLRGESRKISARVRRPACPFTPHPINHNPTASLLNLCSIGNSPLLHPICFLAPSFSLARHSYLPPPRAIIQSVSGSSAQLQPGGDATRDNPYRVPLLGGGADPTNAMVFQKP